MLTVCFLFLVDYSMMLLVSVYTASECAVENVESSEEVTGGWSKLHSEELHNLYSLPDIIRMIKSRLIYVAFMGELINAYEILVGET
jgi:hypothetical protein